MSRGFGVAQRHILDILATTTVDPMADFEQYPCWQSWTPLSRLTLDSPGPSEIESARRAARKLEAAGLVECCTLIPVSKRHRLVKPAVRDEDGELIEPSVYEISYERHRGNQTLHVRLALPEDQRAEYVARERAWRSGGATPQPAEWVVG